MRYKLLGRSGLRVSELCLGTMTFGQGREWGADALSSRAVFDRYVEAGGNFFDTAPGYQDGASEEMLGEFVGSERDRFVIATKFSLSGRAGDPNGSGNGRKSIVQALEASLKRLRADHVDVYWMHAWDGITPEEEVLRALDDLVRAGKILHIGFSDTPAWVVSRSQAIAELRNWTALAAIQVRYSLLDRTADRDLLPMAAALGLSVLTWGSLGAGLLSGKYDLTGGTARGSGRLAGPDYRDQATSAQAVEIVAAVCEIAQSLQATPTQVALAWVRRRAPMIIPLIGARTAEQLADNLQCLAVADDDDAIATLDMTTAVDPGFPVNFLQSDKLQTLLFNECRGKIDAATRWTV